MTQPAFDEQEQYDKIAAGLLNGEQLACGVDLIAAQLQQAAGRHADLKPRWKRHAGVAFVTAPLSGRLGAVSGQDRARLVPGIHLVDINSSVGSTVSPATNASQRLGCIIAVAANRHEVDEALSQAMEEIRVHVY